MLCSGEVNSINKVTFTKKNGFCPYYVLDNTKFYIQDKLISSDATTYTLMSKNLNHDVKQFPDVKQAVDYIKNQINGRPFRYYNFEAEMWETASKIFVLDSKGRLVIREKPTELSYPFDSYKECLLFAKKYISDLIKSIELSLFG